MKIFGHDFEFKSNGASLFLGGVGVGFLLSKVVSRCTSVAKAILTRQNTGGQTDEPVLVSGGNQRVHYEITLSGIGLAPLEVSQRRDVGLSSTQTDEPIIVSGGNQTVDYDITLSGVGLDLRSVQERRSLVLGSTQTDQPVVVSLGNDRVNYEITLSGIGLDPQDVVRTTNMYSGSMQTDEPIIVSGGDQRVNYDITLSGIGLDLQLVRQTRNVSLGSAQTDDERTFYCQLDQVNQEYPVQSLSEHSIQIGQHRFATYNLILAMLAQSNPQNPLTRTQLSNQQLEELANHCGVSPSALGAVWSECRERLIERRSTDPRVNPDDSIQQIDDRFENLFKILTNQVAYKSDPKIIQQRLKFLSLLETQEVWVKKFGKKPDSLLYSR